MADVAIVRHVNSCEVCRSAVEALEETADQPVRPRGALAMRYRLVGVKAQGGQGVICEAFDRVLQRRVAIKLASTEGAQAQRILDEARALAAFSHPRVVTVHDAGIDGGFAFVVMDLIEGESCDVLALDPRFDVRTAGNIVCQVAEGLRALHDAGLVHGDVSPRNIVVDANGNATLIDFGFASTGQFHGLTPGYVAPEVLVEQRTCALSDQYALGRVLTDLLGEARGSSVAASVVARRASHHVPALRYESVAAMRRSLRWSPLRTAVPWLAVVALLFLPSRHSNEVDAWFGLLEEQAFVALEDGRRADGLALARRALALAEREDSNAARVRSLLLVGRTSADGRSALKRAIRLAEESGEPDLRAEGLALLAGLEESPSAQKTLLELAEATSADSPPVELFAAVRATAQLPPSKTEPASPLIDLIATMTEAADTIDDPDANVVPLDCDAVDARAVRATCLAIDAGARADKTPARAVVQANRALELFAGTDEVEGLAVAHAARAWATIESDPQAAHDDLRASLTSDPELGDDELAPERAMLAYALLRLGRPDEARAMFERVEPWQGHLGKTSRRFFERARAELGAK